MISKYILDELIKLEIKNCFNPYLSNCNIYDNQESFEIRRSNLLKYLSFIIKSKTNALWIGEALGYRGGRRTGIPFVDDYHLNYLKEVLQIEVEQATNSTIKEVTAGIIWTEIKKLDQIPFLWNIFPLQPYQPSNTLTNRTPKFSEIKASIHILQYLLDNYTFDSILAIGKSSFKMLQKLNFNCTYIRHPSYGGANKFRKQISQQY